MQISYTLLRGQTTQIREHLGHKGDFVSSPLNVYHLSSKIERLHNLLRFFFFVKNEQITQWKVKILKAIRYKIIKGTQF